MPSVDTTLTKRALLDKHRTVLDLINGITVSISAYNKGRIPLELVVVQANDGSGIEGITAADSAVGMTSRASSGEHSDSDCLHYSYRSPDGSAQAQIRLEIKQEILLAYVEAKLVNESLFGKQSYFSPDAAVTLSLGQPLHDGYMANYRHKDWWTRPHFGPEWSTLPERTQSLLWKTTSEQYVYLLPICDDVCRTDLKGDGSGLQALVSPLILGHDSIQTLAFAISCASDPYDLARKVASGGLQALNLQHRTLKEYPQMMEYIGWCSWDAFYHEVHAEGVLQKAQELQNLRLPIRWFMIDDGWLDVSEMTLRSLKPDGIKFPGGLLPVTERLKGEFGVDWVGVWHTIAGYWGGISRQSPIAQQYKEFLYETRSGKLIPYPAADKGSGFWCEWHRDLKDQGIDFVKVDSQNSITNLTMYNLSAGEAAAGAHAALETSVNEFFDGCIMNCMGMGSENVWHRPTSSLSRNSDDFVPQTAGSFKEHALQNVYNSFYHGQFYWGDWDMFWTRHEDALQSAVLRAVSGGPVYFSDPVGATDPDLVWPLIYRDGRILRGDLPAQPTEDCLLQNPNLEHIPLKVWNQLGESAVIAAFNVLLEDGQVAGAISPSDVPCVHGEVFVLYEPIQKQVLTLRRDESLAVQLEQGEVALYNVIPAGTVCTPIGLIDKYLSSAAVVQVEELPEKTVVQLVEGGIFGFVTDGVETLHAFIDGEEVPVHRNGDWFEIDCSDIQGKPVIEIFHQSMN